MSAHSTSRRAYTIPQRRGGDQEVEPRGLGDLDYGNWKLVLLFRAQGGFGSPSKQAPFRVTMVPKTEVDNFDEHLQNLILGSDSDSVAYIHLPKQLPLEEGAAEVLQWFSSTCREQGTGDCPVTDSGAQLALPSSLSPEERKRWHQIARTSGLYSSSSGLRENRRLLVHASAAESNEQWQRRDLKAQAQAREAYELLCEAHGGHSSYSVSELEEMIVSGVDLPPEILTQKTIKSAAADLWEALDAGRAGQAIKLLQQTEFPRELACRRNAERSSYPMHAAVSGNMPDVAIELANPSRYAGVFTQRDSSGKTALGLACASRQVDLVIAFMNAGARDVGRDIDALHRTLIRTGDHTSRRLLNACPYTTAFRRKTKEGAQGGSGKPVDENLSRRDTSSRRQVQGPRMSREQEKDSCQSGDVSTEESSAQSEAPKEATRRRLAATGVNSLKALLQHNAATLASSPSPSSRMSEVREAKQSEPSAPRVRRGRGRFQGSEEAAAGDASEPVLRQHGRGPPREPAGDEGSHTAVPTSGVDAEDHTAQSHVSGNGAAVRYVQEAPNGQATVVQNHHVAGQMPSIPEQHVQAAMLPQNSSGVHQVPAGAELVHQSTQAFTGVPVAESAHGSPQYSTAQMQYTTLAPMHTDGSGAVQAQPQQYAAGNYTYVTSPGAAPGGAAVAPVGQTPGQVMYVLVTGSDGGQYLLPVMEAQVA